MFKLFPTRNKVLFISRQSDRPSYDFVRLARELQQRDPDIEIHTLCKFMRESAFGRIAYTPELVRQMFHLATSRVCIVDGYVIPVCMLHHRNGLFIIQIWHALGAIKRFGYQSVGLPDGRSAALAKAMRMHRNYDAILCGSDSMVPVFAEAFDADPSIVLPLGLPRVDYLLECVSDQPPQRHQAAVKRLQERFPRLGDSTKKRVLYAPTYRRRRKSILPEALRSFGAEDCTLIVKLHDLESHVMSGDNVVDATGMSVLDLLPLADLVITDYSAVAFEACVLGKPLFYYIPDIDEYVCENGLNLNPLVDVPNVSSTDASKVAEWIRTGSHDADARRSLAVYPGCSSTSDCTSRITDLVMTHMGDKDNDG